MDLKFAWSPSPLVHANFMLNEPSGSISPGPPGRNATVPSGQSPKGPRIRTGFQWEVPGSKKLVPSFPAYASQTSARCQGASPDRLQLRVCWHFDLPLTAARLSLPSAPTQQNQQHPNATLSGHRQPPFSSLPSIIASWRRLCKKHRSAHLRTTCAKSSKTGGPWAGAIETGHLRECGSFDTFRHRR